MGEDALFLWAEDPKWEWFSTKKCEKISFEGADFTGRNISCQHFSKK